MEQFDDPNQYEDVTVAVGCDLVWGFTIQPWDATGTTAVFTLGGSPFSVVVSVDTSGQDALSTFSVHLIPAQLASVGLNVSGATANYTVRETMTDGSVIQIGNGVILAQ